MSDISELEQKWVRYKKRKLLKFAGAASVVFAVIGLLVYLSVRTPPVTLESENTDNNISVAGKDNSSVAGGGKQLPKVAALQPEVPSVADGGVAQSDAAEEEVHERPRLNIRVTELPVSDNEEPAVGSDNSMDMQLAGEKKESVIKEMEARFSLSKDYDEALYIARYYYAKKRYKKSEEWAMKANGIDSTQEDSWIIFGKAKARQGDRAGALKVLQAYYDHTGSIKVGELIDKIRKGKPY